MKTKKILRKLNKGMISADEAVEMMEGKTFRKRRFVKIKIKTNRKVVNQLLSVLLMLPIPITLLKRIIKKHVGKTDMPISEMLDLIKKSEMSINVSLPDGVTVSIKNI